jgi:hypothetical protein
MAQAPFYAKLGPGGIMAIYLTAKEYNVPFMASLNGGMHTFDGKVIFSAQLINAMIINAGHCVDLLHLDEQKCVIRFTRCDRRNDPKYKPLEYEYTIEQAHKAGYLSKNNWKTSPKDMLFSRCLTGGGRKHIPEIFVGVLVAGELVGETIDGNIMPSCAPEIKPPQEPAKELEYDRAPGFDDFMNTWKLWGLLDRDGIGNMTPVTEFILQTAETTKTPLAKILNAAVTNQSAFKKRFNAWEEKNYPQEEQEEQDEEGEEPCTMK